MTTKAISDLADELKRIRRMLGGFDYASVEDRIAEELLSSGYVRQAAPGGGAMDWELRAHDSVKHHALVGLYKLCRTLGNFKNGVEHNGIDEGEVYASGIFDHVEAVLRIPYPALPQEAPAQPQAAREPNAAVLLNFLGTIARFPITDPKNMDAINMRLIAQGAIEVAGPVLGKQT